LTPLELLSSSHDLDPDLGLAHTAYRRASLIELYLHINFIEIKKNYFVDGLTAGTPPSQGHVTQKLGQTSKIRSDQIYTLCLVEVSVVICQISL